MNYKEFQKDYISKLAKGKKFNMREFSNAWNLHKSGDKTPDSKVLSANIAEIPQKVDLKPQNSTVLDVDAQPAGIIQSNIVQPPAPIVKASVSSVSSDVFTAEDLQDLAEAIHLSIFRLIELGSKGKIKVSDQEKTIGRLNRFGAKLLKKYDEKGFLEKYCLEIAYGASVLGIVLEILFVVKADPKVEDPMKKRIAELESANTKLLEELKFKEVKEVPA